MKKFLFTIFILLVVFLNEGKAQSRKYISQFSHLQNYYSPALTGYEGSSIRGFVRNQWAGFEGAPKTYLLSAEMDMADLGGSEASSGKNALGLTMLHDNYGAFAETGIITSYASRIQVTNRASIRMGIGVNYNTIRLDGHRMTTEQADDEILANYLNGFATSQILDFNLGLALTHPNYYFSYAVHNVNRGAISSGDEIVGRNPREGILQFGFRSMVDEGLAVIFNGMHNRGMNLPSNTEFNFKVLLRDRLWIGGGHRMSYANNFQLGVLLPNMRIGYVYELPMNKSYLLPNTTHEFMAVFPLFRENIRKTENEVLIW
ncbi:PorP/SprF family type IX secretion system membrane protein [Pleomorphovibrio marinus]|uniref:PorP/SprF family type IX secretion system membrane protein n=1 Tax=Pleomorphovibrio marinus TaxID=2164132 RepID=UPI000E0BE482|nr:PorP/SprF family type IX secretion system membrane protein [Pleomorphovibrio marinus]